MGAGLVRRQVPGVHLLLDVRVVLGDLGELAVAQQVGAAVAHLADEEARVVEHERRDGGPHAALVVLGERALENRGVGRPDRLAHPFGDLLVAQALQGAELASDEFDRHLARDFARRMPPHPVGHDEDAAIGDHEVVILVPRADNADIGAACAGDVHAIPGYERIQ